MQSDALLAAGDVEGAAVSLPNVTGLPAERF